MFSWVLKLVQAFRLSSIRSSEKVDCIVCGDSVTASSAIQAPCIKQHYYDRACLRRLALLATKDESLMPCECDNVEIPVRLLRRVLNRTELSAYKKKLEEVSIKNRLYCYVPTCSAFIGRANPKRKVGIKCTAEGCTAVTCKACRAPWHGVLGACAIGADQEVVDALTRKYCYQRCPDCSRMIELRSGCYHIICICRQQFCYICASPWRTCHCPQRNDDGVVQRAREQVRQEYKGRYIAAPHFSSLVEQHVADLRQNEDCDHSWERRYGGGECESCDAYLRLFLMECTECEMLACRRCTQDM